MFQSLAAKITAGIVCALAIALAFVIWRADGLSDSLEAKRNELASERAAHAITRGSVETLQGALEKFVGAGKAARAAQLSSIEAQAPRSAVLRGKAAAIRAELESLEPDDQCRTPGFVMED